MTQPGTPLNQPLHGASFGQAIGRFYRKYATFSGRASRSEYWWVALYQLITYSLLVGLSLGLGLSTSTDGGDTPGPAGVPFIILLLLVLLANLIPGLALTVRRLHDVNLSGWLILLNLLPSLGSLILFVLSLLPSSPLGVRFDKPVSGQYS